LKFRVFLLIVSSTFCLVAEPAAFSPDAFVDNYISASLEQDRSLKGASMEVEFAASLPRLKKQGRLHALRRISPLGFIKYEMLHFDGDSTVNKQVIARYLSAEAEAQKERQQPSLAVTPRNYRFKYKGLGQLDGRTAHIFQVTPKRNRQGLFTGEVWIDAATCLRVRESGCLVKSPSIFLKKVAFIRRYEIRDGISVPRQVRSVVDTRLVGRAELTIEFINFSIDSNRAIASEADGQ